MKSSFVFNRRLLNAILFFVHSNADFGQPISFFVVLVSLVPFDMLELYVHII